VDFVLWCLLGLSNCVLCEWRDSALNSITTTKLSYVFLCRVHLLSVLSLTQLKRNRPLLTLWIKLYVVYNKMFYLLNTFPEMFALIPMYCAAHKLSGGELSAQRLQEYVLYCQLL
jgi:hypothetical protein